MSLKRSLRRRQVPMRLHDIWDDPEAAAVVRRAARGDETVPTVVVAGRALVNPSAREVEALVEQLLPELLADRGTDRRRSWFGRRR
jgi:mycoredoxin